MEERILEMARTLSGAGEADLPALALLCAAAQACWESRLPRETTAEDCGPAFLCAAACTAAAGFMAGQGTAAVSFTAGDISVRGPGGGERQAAARSLERTAERLMSPYVSPGDLFLKGVRG